MTKQSQYFFKYENEVGETKWYVSEVIEVINESKSLVIATVIDPQFHEYQTEFLFNVDLTSVKFFKDKYEFLVSEWGETKASEHFSKL
jgi:hypothetical protein